MTKLWDTNTAHAAILARATALMRRKNAHYGDAWRMYRMTTFLDRGKVKLHRADSLWAKPGELGLHNVGATLSQLLDIINETVFCAIKALEESGADLDFLDKMDDEGRLPQATETMGTASPPPARRHSRDIDEDDEDDEDEPTEEPTDWDAVRNQVICGEGDAPGEGGHDFDPLYDNFMAAAAADYAYDMARVVAAHMVLGHLYRRDDDGKYLTVKGWACDRCGDTLVHVYDGLACQARAEETQRQADERDAQLYDTVVHQADKRTRLHVQAQGGANGAVRY